MVVRVRRDLLQRRNAMLCKIVLQHRSVMLCKIALQHPNAMLYKIVQHKLSLRLARMLSGAWMPGDNLLIEVVQARQLPRVRTSGMAVAGAVLAGAVVE